MSDSGLEIRDRRELPFFMVRVQALRAIRTELHGLRRARALGAYVTLCAEANRQRATGDHERLYLTQVELAERLGAGRSSLRDHLATLTAAGAVAQRRRYTDDGQPLPTEISLPIQGPAFVAISVATLERLEARADRRTRLGTLGLYTVLLELCNEQRGTQGGARAEATRRALADRVGVAVRSLDAYASELVSAELLEITRRALENRSHRPNLWELHEPQPAQISRLVQLPSLPSAEPDPTPRKTQLSPAQEPILARAEPDPSPGAICASPGPEIGAVTPRPRKGQEEQLKEHPPRDPHTAGPTPPATAGESADFDDELTALCERLASSVAQRTTPKSRIRPGGWDADRSGWLAAAASIVADGYSPTRIGVAIDGLSEDWYLGGRLLTMPALAASIDEAVIRAETRARQHTSSTDDGFDAVWSSIERAIRRHGADRRTAAVDELSAENPRCARFVELVGWRELCRQPLAMHRRAWQQAWRATAAPDDQEIA